MHRRLLTVIALSAFCLSFAALASASQIYVTNIPEFSGGVYYDPGPFPTYLVGSFAVYPGAGTLQIDGTFGNSAFPYSSAGVDVFVGSPTAGFFLVAQCFEYDPCWSGGGPYAWSGGVRGIFSSDTWDIYASQTSEAVVRLGAMTVTETVGAVPEPSSLMMLGTAVVGVAGVIRRKYIV